MRPTFKYLFEVDAKRNAGSAYVYVLTDENGANILYVGVTCQPEVRQSLHRSKNARLRRCGNVRMFVIAIVPNDQARVAENYFIGYFRSLSHPIINRNKSIFEMRKIAKLYGGKCLSDHYDYAGTRLSWTCARGHEFSLSAREVMIGAWCPICSLEMSNRSRLGIMEIRARNKLRLRRDFPALFNLM